MSWFESWFNSPYYHILYDHRDDREAELFLDQLLNHLKPAKGSSMLDLGCGRGRHSQYLKQKGNIVTGIDLSPESIRFCSQFEEENLSFFVHDMRHLFRTNDFDYVFNLFTSFGYFTTDRENVASIIHAAMALKPGGILILDYLNTEYVKRNLITNEKIVKKGIEFSIKRDVKDGFINKEITFEAEGKSHYFIEKVAALSKQDFERYFAEAGLHLRSVYGNYNLESWDSQNSPRLILEAIKTH
ncbi:MAG TPA: class I SAM-dependent methyltransferase [Bacteroidia bacterium]|nr:class I SAM-dependent methyltransferase [Bacteroidia bacterium]